MSLFSRLFRKAPPAPAAPEKAPEPSARPAIVKQPEHRETERAVTAAREEEALRAALQGPDAQALGKLVLEARSSKIRRQAAEAIQDLGQLRQLIKEVRGGNDKTVYKILTHKRDAQLAEVRQLEQQQAEVTAAASALERHSHRPYDPLFAPILEQHEIRWRAVADRAAPETAATVREAIDRAHEVIAGHVRQVEAQAARQAAAAAAAAEAERQRALADEAAAATAAERARALAEQRQAEAQKQEAQSQAFRQIGGLVRKALGALDDGSTGRAAGLRRALEEKLPDAPPLPPHLIRQLQQLDARLAELKDWKSFTVAPKRVELMEEMESLIDASLEPPVLAERIRRLQEEWRTLSKGAGENLEADWQRFHDAAQKAYQPCREHFERQAQARQENLQRRTALLERLSAFAAGHDWSRPDWRTVMVALRESKQEWRRYSPVERAAGKALQERFAALSADLQGRLDGEYARNTQEKRALIDQAQRLLTAVDSRAAIQDVKALQQKWKAVGLVPRADEQRLWEEFRQHCDAVYQRRQQDFAEYTAALEANKSKAVALCEELESIATSSGADLLASAGKVSELRLAFEAAGEFPRGSANELRNRFERAAERCEAAVARQQASDAERSWMNLLDAADKVRAYRLAAARQAESAERDALRESAERFIAGVGQWPKGGLESLKKALASQIHGDPTANEAALRKLCIRAEIFTDRPTPAEDQALRREHQVQRLVQGMGQGVGTDAAELDTLALEWVGVGPTEDGPYGTLEERFRRSRQHWLGQR